MIRSFYTLSVVLFISGLLDSCRGTQEIQLSVNDLKNITSVRTRSMPFSKLGNHIIAELTGCQNLNNFEQLEKTLRTAAENAGATVLAIKTHQFDPVGMSGVAVLAESHISIHTWPELGYAAIDIFTCGAHVNTDKALEVLESFFKPQQVQFVTVSRGYTNT